MSRSASHAGVSETNLRYVPVTRHLRMDLDALRDFVRRDRRAGWQPLCVVPSAGTTNRTAMNTSRDQDEMVCAMRLLTPHQRVAGVLTGYLGYSSEEAAKLLGVRPSTARALRQVRHLRAADLDHSQVRVAHIRA